ncbi:MAG: hypothetical protein AVDCRST_MAG21-619 [uncultured Nocardioidaceae bacterium]|uniref:Methyltransferase type 11 domain-containing protein n=1 Tax=uncultured Nocardioidaceae bacterium TaxID=253824 RepID=A0A6J4MY66_9ACTN|nr:MAG: hypothetical protein AVDCRST_MAG21-619 [uncultured Nocardioidaceae bacterium]
MSSTASSPIFQHPLGYLIGLEGVALMRAFAGEYDEAFTAARLTEVKALLDTADTFGDGVAVPALAAATGYDGWAPSYDDPGNAIFGIEEPVVWPILDGLAPGVAVDAACGTGRHAEHLVASGHDVHGFDISPGMLEVARAKVPGARFSTADVTELPLADSSVDLVVCALALAHIENLGAVFAEFARILRPGGQLVISDTRGQFVGSGRYPLVKRALDGRFGYLPTWRHETSDYLRSSLPLGFEVLDCQEPRREAGSGDLGTATPPAPQEPPDIWDLMAWAPAATVAAYRDTPALIVWHFRLKATSAAS